MIWDFLLGFLKILLPVGLVLLLYFVLIRKQKHVEEEDMDEEKGIINNDHEHYSG
ncbi:MAG: hypothetical protein ISR55_09795 [Bacteroidetes bacterium]|nr:hypothetical protein [Bacteroidota bacterium]MBL6964108.1 hypothetical protein [Bacteroidota bacterium]